VAAPAAPAEKLSYSAPSEDALGDVEVRNQRGQVERAATAKAQQAAAAQGLGRVVAPQQPSNGGARGAFGQKSEPTEPVAGNRSQRRAQDKKK
jgi:preprotein translocase subunit SecA